MIYISIYIYIYIDIIRKVIYIYKQFLVVESALSTSYEPVVSKYFI